MSNLPDNHTDLYFTGNNHYMIAATTEKDENNNDYTKFQVFSLCSVDVQEIPVTQHTDKNTYVHALEKIKEQYNVSNDDFAEIYRLMDNGRIAEAEEKATSLRKRLPYEPELTGILTTIFLEKT